MSVNNVHNTVINKLQRERKKDEVNVDVSKVNITGVHSGDTLYSDHHSTQGTEFTIYAHDDSPGDFNMDKLVYPPDKEWLQCIVNSDKMVQLSQLNNSHFHRLQLVTAEQRLQYLQKIQRDSTNDLCDYFPDNAKVVIHKLCDHYVEMITPESVTLLMDKSARTIQEINDIFQNDEKNQSRTLLFRVNIWKVKVAYRDNQVHFTMNLMNGVSKAGCICTTEMMIVDRVELPLAFREEKKCYGTAVEKIKNEPMIVQFIVAKESNNKKKLDHNMSHSSFIMMTTTMFKDNQLYGKGFDVLLEEMEHPEQLPEIVKYLKWMSCGVLKSLIQKCIRTGAHDVILDLEPLCITNCPIFRASGVDVLCTAFFMLYLHPGYFSPELNTFITGKVNAFKRAGVSIAEDSCVSYLNLHIIMAQAFLSQASVPSYEPTVTMMKKTLQILKSAIRNEDTYWHYNVDGCCINISELVQAYITKDSDYFLKYQSYLYLNYIGALKSDIPMVYSICRQNEVKTRDEKLIKGRIRMPLYHALDQHCKAILVYYLGDVLVLKNILELSMTNDYRNITSIIWDYLSSLNPRKVPVAYLCQDQAANLELNNEQLVPCYKLQKKYNSRHENIKAMVVAIKEQKKQEVSSKPKSNNQVISQFFHSSSSSSCSSSSSLLSTMKTNAAIKNDDKFNEKNMSKEILKIIGYAQLLLFFNEANLEDLCLPVHTTENMKRSSLTEDTMTEVIQTKEKEEEAVIEIPSGMSTSFFSSCVAPFKKKVRHANTVTISNPESIGQILVVKIPSRAEEMVPLTGEVRTSCVVDFLDHTKSKMIRNESIPVHGKIIGKRTLRDNGDFGEEVKFDLEHDVNNDCYSRFYGNHKFSNKLSSSHSTYTESWEDFCATHLFVDKRHIEFDLSKSKDIPIASEKFLKAIMISKKNLDVVDYNFMEKYNQLKNKILQCNDYEMIKRILLYLRVPEKTYELRRISRDGTGTYLQVNMYDSSVFSLFCNLVILAPAAIILQSNSTFKIKHQMMFEWIRKDLVTFLLPILANKITCNDNNNIKNNNIKNNNDNNCSSSNQLNRIKALRTKFFSLETFEMTSSDIYTKFSEEEKKFMMKNFNEFSKVVSTKNTFNFHDFLGWEKHDSLENLLISNHNETLLRPVQMNAIHRVLDKIKRHERGHLIWQKVGTGKTREIIVILHELLREKTLPFKHIIYITTKSSMESVKNEFQTFGFNGKIRAIPKTKDIPILPTNDCVYFIDHSSLSYDDFTKALQVFANDSFVIFDEVHELMNPTKKTSTAMTIASICVDFIGMTGTFLKDKQIKLALGWLKPCASFPIDMDNFWAGMSLIVSHEVRTHVLCHYYRTVLALEQFKNGKYLMEYSNAQRDNNIYQMMTISQHASNEFLLEAIVDYFESFNGNLQQAESIFFVCAKQDDAIFCITLLKKLLTERKVTTDSKNLIYLCSTNGDSSLCDFGLPDFHHANSSNYRIFFAPFNTAKTGYNLTQCGIQVSSVNLGNEGSQEQIKGRINRFSQQRSKVHYWTVMTNGAQKAIFEKNQMATQFLNYAGSELVQQQSTLKINKKGTKRKEENQEEEEKEDKKGTYNSNNNHVYHYEKNTYSINDLLI